MATATSNLVCDNSSLANFQAWTSAIYNAFVTTCGWVQTADTGQAANPIAAVPSSAYVYWIFRANDTQASTLPIFVKVELGFSATAPSIRMTVGAGSNGTGTITNIMTGFNATVISNNGNNLANQGATAYPCYFSGDAGEFRMLLWVTNATAGVTTHFGIERSKDATGAKTTAYFTALFCSSASNANSSNRRQQTTLSSLSVTTYETIWVTCGLSTNSNTAAFGGTVAAFPVFPVLGQVGNPMLGHMVALAADVGDGATVTVASMYGSTHTYVSCKSGGTSSGFQFLGLTSVLGASSALLMRYE